MGIKEEFLEWCKPISLPDGKPTLGLWHDFNRMADTEYSDEYFHNVIMAEETAEEEIKETPLMFQTDPGLIGGNIDLVDMST